MNSSVNATVRSTAEIVLQLAVSQSASVGAKEELSIRLDGESLEPTEVVGVEGTRWHLLPEVPPGRLEVRYSAQTETGGAASAATPLDLLTWCRPSRYVDIDRLEASASALFGTSTGAHRLELVTDWVRNNLSYVVGSSRVGDGASDTFLARAGVCRDYAHLTIALLRAGGVPARLVSVYAPGLAPMDFHAVVEAHVEGGWRLVDTTGLAPRASMVRIGTGADAADTSFFTVHRGWVDFGTVEVQATVSPELPSDDQRAPVHLA